ncbi:MAG: YdcH family protein [Bradymonadaceae bacterium]|nr:YdcH family protein [Lujinxingiaceae bacterium]
MSQSLSSRNVLRYDDLEMLRVEHQSLENRLVELDQHRSLSPEEQYEVQVIKKRKLFLKDRMHSLEATN